MPCDYLAASRGQEGSYAAPGRAFHSPAHGFGQQSAKRRLRVGRRPTIPGRSRAIRLPGHRFVGPRPTSGRQDARIRQHRPTSPAAGQRRAPEYGARGTRRDAPRAIIRASGAEAPPSAQEDTPIDIIFLVERLESLIANGKKLPLTTNVVVDQNAALGLIDELRVAVPEEVRAAKRINSEGERIIEKAQEEAERIVARAQEQAAFLIDERGLTQAADEESRRIIANAQSDADEIRRGADEYAVSVLVGLEGDVVKTLQSIKKGIAMLDERRSELIDGRASDNGVADEEAWEGEGEAEPARR